MRSSWRAGPGGVARCLVVFLGFILLWCRAVPAAASTPTEWRALGGALLETSSHGEVDVGLRRGPWRLELYTDTLQAAYSPELSRGRVWAALRAQGGAAGLMITPWTEGNLDPSRALSASYLGPELYWVRYLPAGIYAGLGGSLSAWRFGSMPTTTRAVPPWALVARSRILLGYYHPSGSVEVSGGIDRVDHPGSAVFEDASFSGALVQSAAELSGGYRPRAWLAPRIEVFAGTSTGRGELLATRVGGSMPYGIPLAGTGWSELWVQRHMVLRWALFAGNPDAAPGSGVGAEAVVPPQDTALRVRAGLRLDVGVLGGVIPIARPAGTAAPPEAQLVVGAAANVVIRRRAVWAQTEIARASLQGQGRWPVTVMIRVGRDWRPIQQTGRPR